MPQRWTVLVSIKRNTTFSTASPISMIVSRPANTSAILSWFLLSKMYQPRPPCPDEAQAGEIVIAPNHARRHRNAAETGEHVERHRPHHRVDQHEDQAARAEAEPDQRQRQQGDGRQ